MKGKRLVHQCTWSWMSLKPPQCKVLYQWKIDFFWTNFESNPSICHFGYKYKCTFRCCCSHELSLFLSLCSFYIYPLTRIYKCFDVFFCRSHNNVLMLVFKVVKIYFSRALATKNPGAVFCKLSSIKFWDFDVIMICARASSWGYPYATLFVVSMFQY